MLAELHVDDGADDLANLADDAGLLDGHCSASWPAAALAGAAAFLAGAAFAAAAGAFAAAAFGAAVFGVAAFAIVFTLFVLCFSRAPSEGR